MSMRRAVMTPSKRGANLLERGHFRQAVHVGLISI